MSILLLVVLAILVVGAFIGYKRGFVKIVASLLATLISVILVMMLVPHVSGWIQKSTPLKSGIQKKCIEMISPAFDGEKLDETVLQMDIPSDAQISIIEEAKLPAIFQDMLRENNNPVVYESLGVNSFFDYVTSYITKVVADIIAFLVTFLLVLIIVRVAIKFLGIVNKIPLIGGANRIVGAVVGGAISLLIVWIIFIIITLLYNTPIGISCLDAISDNAVLKALYDGNPLMNVITKF